MELWIARDSDGSLFIYDNKPKKNTKDKSFSPTGRVYIFCDEWFPEVTFENSPQRVELKLIEE